MDNYIGSEFTLSSFHRLYRVLGTVLVCVALNFSIVMILPMDVRIEIVKDVLMFSDMNIGAVFFFGVILAPVWETVFQAFPAYMLGRHPSKGRVFGYLIMSAVPFAFIHTIGYSALYAVLLLPTSFILAYTYYYFWRRNQSPYLMTALVHGVYNLIVFISYMLTGLI